VDARDIRDLVHFDEDAPRRGDLFESDRIWSEVVCLQRSQRIGPLADPSSDAIVTILAGRVAAQVGNGRKRVSQWESMLVRAGEELTVANASDDPSVVLIVAAPPPRRTELA
jgi:quercetin dioxygenase-like cupin family protein